MEGYTCSSISAGVCTMGVYAITGTTADWHGWNFVGSTGTGTTQNLDHIDTPHATGAVGTNHATYLEQNSTTGVVTTVPLQSNEIDVVPRAAITTPNIQFYDGTVQTTAYKPPKDTNMHDHGLVCFGLGLLVCYLLMKWRPSIRLGELSDENKQGVALTAHIIGLLIAAITGVAIIVTLFTYIIGSM